MTGSQGTDDRDCSRAAVFPFSAIVGQEKMKLALVLCAVDPSLHGVLVRGERGTAKSTAARALAALLPEQLVVSGCQFGCDPIDTSNLCRECREALGAGRPLERSVRRTPFVDLPIGATEDRVLGTVDLEQALTRGRQVLRPGLLAGVNRGILYIDEVNLLGDHLMDLLLDAAAMGLNVVEREGISHAHPSRFILVGTMNPEEGNLRPQLTDRFDLGIEVRSVREGASRREVLERRLEFEADPRSFVARYEAAELELAARIVAAGERLRGVAVPAWALDRACDLADSLSLDGHRAEMAIVKAARAMAALDGRAGVSIADLERGAELAVPHRLRSNPLDDDDGASARVARALERLREAAGGQTDPALDRKDPEEQEKKTHPPGHPTR